MLNNTEAKNAGALISINFGNGLVEIGALTTLIGSTTAGDLVLGNRGSAGLVWGSITSFGTSSVIKACASAASPGWLRHMLGLRTPASDAAVGMSLPLEPSKFAQSVRSSLHSPLGVSCNSGPEEFDDPIVMKASTAVDKRPPYRDVYAFDRATSVMLEELTATSAGDPLMIHTFHAYPFFRTHKMRFQIAVLGLSLFKRFEIFFLLTYGGILMGLLSAIPFTLSFLSATIVEIRDITVSRRPMDVDGHVDLVAGTLPTTKQLGGPRKVVLGAMKNPRTTIWWRAFWALNAILQTTSLVVSYLLLGQQETRIVLAWAAFQLAWVTLRIFIFHLTDSSEPMADRPMSGHQLSSLPPSMRLRVANLVLAVANYQMHLHPRGIEGYREDTLSAKQIATLLAAPNVREVYELRDNDIQPNSSVQLNILAIVGDTALSSAAWMIGSKLTPMDLYDSCIVVLSYPQTEKQAQQIVAIPAARVYTARASLQSAMTDSENVQPLFIPRGAGAQAADDEQAWVYWIPTDSGRWLQIKSTNLTVLGKITAEVMDDIQLTKKLGAGNLNISLKDAEDVKGIVDYSRKAANCLLPFLH
ncbi:hypothetical protein GALMADRAFT_250714 [Galerina marginata CBS 339.88]|uniref:Uncharacterized protein n=1 Tax=Galerina marginata (strain CBS 339.88) TaxID=685588 RepID=A0A067T252_GALM3|nr:hypothetical protein GALMADRAFT_250714 [Galerina marginata CBS 339.88]